MNFTIDLDEIFDDAVIIEEEVIFVVPVFSSESVTPTTTSTDSSLILSLLFRVIGNKLRKESAEDDILRFLVGGRCDMVLDIYSFERGNG